MSFAGLFAIILSVASTASAAEPDKSVMVNVDNFVRAETASQFDRVLKFTGGVNRFVHLREPTPLDKQNVIRMKRLELCGALLQASQKDP